MPRQPMTVAEKQQRALLRRMAKQKGKALAQQQESIKANAQREMYQYRVVLEEHESNRGTDGNIARVGGTDIRTYQAFNLAEAIRNVTSVVRASFGVDQSIEYDYASSRMSNALYARTNLKKIQLMVNLVDFIDVSDEGIKKSIALLKGATYHEVAHCLWTNDWTKVNDDYDFPEGTDWRTYFRAWNLLEDGRIETLLVSKSPIIRNYLLPVVYSVVLNGKNGVISPETIVSAMPFLVVRSYLPEGLRRSALRHTVEAGSDLSILRDMYDLSRQYQAGTTWDEHLPIVLQFHDLLTRWEESHGQGGEDQGEGGHSENWVAVPNPIGDHSASEFSPQNGTPVPVIVPSDNDWNPSDFTPQPPATPPAVEKPKDGQGNSESSGDQSSESESDSESNDKQAPTNKDGASNHGASGASAGESSPLKKVRDFRELEKAFKEAIDDAVSSNEFNEVSKQFNASMKRQVPKARIDKSDAIPEHATTQAHLLSLGMINALDTLCVTPDPSWTTRQPDGPLLDVEAFVTREPGDDRFWVDRDGTGERGHDLAVSVLLDCSGSMESELLNLGVVAYAIRKACGFFDIPCTTTLFGSTSQRLWDAEDEPEVIFMPNMGGTSIGSALLDIPNQRQGKGRHLVVILTDGAWADVQSVRPFLNNGEVSLIVGLNVSTHSLQRGADSAVAIRNLIDFPSEVEKQIARFFV